MKFLTPILVVLLSLLSIPADAGVERMLPLKSERLENPVTLDCGATVVEWWGSEPNYGRANSICTHVKSNFFRFIDLHDLETKYSRDLPFRFSLSFIPYDTCYRCLNDLDDRFSARDARGIVSGYTYIPSRYVFTISDPEHWEYRVTLAHELFHAMSINYGLLEHCIDSRPYDECVAEEERHAYMFTQWLGYGR
jgi:hypothetical protein